MQWSALLEERVFILNGRRAKRWGWIALVPQCRSLALMIDDWYKSTDTWACVSIDHAIASFAMQRIAR
jgi:hypothetical protein